MKAHSNVLHNRNSVFKYDAPYWRETSCSWCGSCKPNILAQAIREGATVEEADRKYGWPHKFYIHGMKIKLPGAQKFYTEHLQDAEPNDLAIIEKAMGLHFEFEGTGVRWSRLP